MQGEIHVTHAESRYISLELSWCKMVAGECIILQEIGQHNIFSSVQLCYDANTLPIQNFHVYIATLNIIRLEVL